MTIWYPDPPQGNSQEQELVIIGRPVIPKFGGPQGVAVSPIGGSALVQTGGFSALVQAGTLSALIQTGSEP